MRPATRFALPALVVLSAVATGCFSGRRCSDASYGADTPDRSSAARPLPGASAGTTAPADASRAVSEADIIQLDHEQNRIYAMSKSGSLAIVDASVPGVLTLMGKTSLSGEPFEMYRRGDVLLTMSNHGVGADGKELPPVPEGAAAPTAPPQPKPNDDGGALISAVDVSAPSNARTIATFKVAGEIADSRIVGNVLYLATYENGTCYGCQAQAPRTLVTTFDISDARAPKQVDQVSFSSPTGAGFNAAWSTPWKRSIVATDERLYVGGLASNEGTTTDEGVIEVLDITDPGGHLVRGAKITMAGPILSRWQMDESDGVLRVVSQRGAGRTSNGEKFPDIDTFRIESTSSFVRLGHTTMTLPSQEGLKTVRFDGPRAYAITFNQTDPLFTIDLSDAAHPAQKGELHMPGWMFHLEPHGDRVIGLGLDRTDQSGNLNVTLFDVSNIASPQLVQRVSFGPNNLYEDYQITNNVLAEDQDRIQKAFRVFDDGLIAVPFSGAGANAGGSACGASAGGGVQLVDWTRTSLTKHALLPVNGNARRAIRRDSDHSQELIAVSDSHVSAFAIEQRDQVKQTADVVFGTCVERTTPNSTGGGWNERQPADYGDDRDIDRRQWSGDLCE